MKITQAHLLPVISLIVLSVHGASSFIDEGSIGSVTNVKTVATNDIGTIEIKDWVGQRFILLPQSKKTQSYGYQAFNPPLPYQEWVGQVLTVSEVKDDYAVPKVTFRSEGGKLITATAYSDTIYGIAPLRDLEYARTNYVGKTFWMKTSGGLATWDSAKDEFGNLNVPKLAPVKVTKVLAGTYSETPIRLILQTEAGETGFKDVCVSGTNVPDILRKYGLETRFFTFDPRSKYQWPTNVWTAIEHDKVFVGMTTDQAKMSWGQPKEINRTTTARGAEEQWVFGDSYLYVSDGKVTAIQN
jgi:hypothetical protein